MWVGLLQNPQKWEGCWEVHMFQRSTSAEVKERRRGVGQRRGGRWSGGEGKKQGGAGVAVGIDGWCRGGGGKEGDSEGGGGC